MEILKCSLRDLWREKVIVVFTALLMVFANARASTISNLEYKEPAASALEAGQCVMFSVPASQRFNWFSPVPVPIIESLISRLDAGGTYAAIRTFTTDEPEKITVIDGFEVADPSSQTPVIVVIGDYQAALGLEEDVAGMTAFVGAGVKKYDVGQTVKLGTAYSKLTEVPIAGRLPKNLAIFPDVQTDNAIVLVASARDVYQHFAKEPFADILHDIIVMVEPTDRQVKDFMAEMNAFDLPPMPMPYGKPHAGLMDVLKFFGPGAVFGLFVLIFAFIAALFGVIQMVDHNMREYAVHMLYGASNRVILLRILLFVLYIMVVPLSLVFKNFWTLVRAGYLPSAFMIGLSLAVMALLVGIPFLRVRKNGMEIFIKRSDE